MHLLAVQPGGFVDDEAFVSSLGQSPADVVVLSAADTTLALLADAYEQLQAQATAPGLEGEPLPTVRLANLMHLRQPASVDLYVDEVLQHARVIVIDHLGGESYWPYGTERVREVCRKHRITLVMFSGCTTEDMNLLQKARPPSSSAAASGATCARAGRPTRARCSATCGTASWAAPRRRCPTSGWTAAPPCAARPCCSWGPSP